MKYKFFDLKNKKWLKGNKTPHGSFLEVISGRVFRRTSDSPSNRYLAKKI